MPQITIDLENSERVGQNLKAIREGKYLILVIDTSKSIGPSKTGKMNGMASTDGFASIADGGIKGNVYIGTKA